MDFSKYPVTLVIIAINVLVSLVGFSNNNFVARTIMWPWRVKSNNEIHRFITSGFLHADFMHLIFNMFTFFFFGASIEQRFAVYGLGGNISYILLYVSALVISDLPSYFKHKDDINYRSLGASGAVSAVVFASIVFDPWTTLWLYGAFRISALIFAVLYIVYCVYMSRKSTDNVNHDAHLWGALYGLVFTIALIALMQPALFDGIIQELKSPSFFGRN
ncbi:MAG: rhomboid family intramembrane serine protease [Ferruginibacter sp.]